jgi:tetratricopeptide (TPR) repeat protein
VARHGKKHAREIKRDRFREETLGFFEKLGNRLEGRGKTILYALGTLVVAAVLAYGFIGWRERKANEARQALGRAIEIASSPVASAQTPNSPTPPRGAQTFATERERAQSAVAEFQKVADKYGDPFRSQANYFKAANLLVVDRPKGLSELDALTKSGDREVSAWAKFALAQARESDGDYDGAAALYKDLASARGDAAIIPADTVNLRLATVYDKQGKKTEAADILFQIVKASRESKDKDGKPVPPSSAAHDADQKLEQLDPARHAQLPPEPPRDFSS